MLFGLADQLADDDCSADDDDDDNDADALNNKN